MDFLRVDVFFLFSLALSLPLTLSPDVFLKPCIPLLYSTTSMALAFSLAVGVLVEIREGRELLELQADDACI